MDPNQTIVFDSLGAGAVFTLFDSSDFSSIIDQQTIEPGVVSATFTETLDQSKTYVATLVDPLGQSTTFYFGLENTAPQININSVTVSPNGGGTAPLVSIAGTAEDVISGLQFVRLALGQYQHFPDGTLSGDAPGDVDNGTIVGNATLNSGDSINSFSFKNLIPGAPYTVGGRNVAGLLAAPPLDIGLDVRSYTAPTGFLIYPARGIAAFLRNVQVTTQMTDPSQTGTIAVYAVGVVDSEVEAYFGSVLTNTVPVLPRTFLGTISGNNSVTFTPNLLSRGHIELELDAPNNPPSVTSNLVSGDVYGLQISPPLFPIVADGTAVPVPTGKDIGLTVGNISVLISSITRPGNIAIDPIPFDAGTNARVIPMDDNGDAASITSLAQAQGPVQLTVSHIAPGVSPGLFKYVPGQSFVDITNSIDPVNGVVTGQTASFVDPTFVLLANPDGSRPPSADTTAPASSVTAQGPSYVNASGTVFVSTLTRAAFTGGDDFSGLEAILTTVDPPASLLPQYRTSRSSFSTYSSPFALSEGTHTLAWAAVDRAQNYQALQLFPISVDGTPPTSTMTFQGPTVASSSGTIVGPRTGIAFAISDPVSKGVASGPLAEGALVDQTSQTCGFPAGGLPTPDPGAPPGSCANPVVTSTLTLAAVTGSRTINFFGIDNVFNTEAPHSTTVIVDADPPVATATAGGFLLATKTPALAGSLTDALAGLATTTLVLSVDGNPVPTNVIFANAGSFSPFQATASPLLVPVRSHAMTALGSTFYVIGGHDNFTNGGIGQRRETSYATLANGALGAWHAGPLLPQPLSSQAAAAANGYVYAMGGGSSNGASQSVYFSQVDANGAPISWQTSPNNLPVAVSDGDGAVVLTQGSFLYFVNPAGPSAYYSDVSAGPPGNWRTTNAPGQAANGARLVQWGSRLFFIGGIANGAATSAVWTTTSNSDGTLAPWTQAASMPARRGWGAAAATNGKILYVSGVDENNQPQATAYAYDVANAAWSTLNFQYPIVTVSNAAAGANGVIVVTGGNNFTNGTAYTNSYLTAMAPSGPIMTATLSAVPSPLTDGNHTLSASGQDAVANPGSVQVSFQVDTTPPVLAMTAQGVALSSMTTAPLPTLSPSFIVTYQDATSGVNASSLSLLLDDMDVTTQAVVSAGQATLQTANLAPGAHALQASIRDNAGNMGLAVGRVFLDVVPPAVVLTSPTAGQFFATSTVRLAALMGDVGIGLDTGTVRLAVDGAAFPVTLSQLQAPQAVWTAGPNLAIPVRSQAMTALGNTFYVIGGHDNFTPPFNLGQVAGSYYATMDANGNLGPWLAGPVMSQAYSSLAAAAARGTVYVMGGGSSGGPTAQFLYAHVNAAGRPDANWTTGQPLPSAVSDGQGAVVLTFGSYLYFINPAAPAIWANQIDNSGNPSSQWVSVPAPSVALAFARVAEWNGRLYLIGGTIGGVAQNQVWASNTTSQSGPISGWTQVTSLPAARSGGAAASLNGQLYYIGGVDQNNQPVKTVYVADASGGGNTLTWTTLPDYPLATGPAAAATDGAVVITGGNNYANGQAYPNTYVWRPPTATFASLAAQATAYGLSEGSHVASATARDLAGNLGLSTAAFSIDMSPPVTSLVVTPSSRVFAGTAYVLAASSLTLGATDYPLVGASGVAATSFAVDGTSVPAPAGAFSLAQGFHAASFFSTDNVGNVEPLKTARLKLDGVPPAPVTSLALAALSSTSVQISWTSPGDDGAVGDIVDAQVRAAFGTDPTAFSLSTSVVVWPSGTLPVGTAFSQVIPGLAPGTTYYAAVFTRDTAGNWSAESATVAVRTPAIDDLPPRTTLAAGFPNVLVGSELFVRPTTPLVLTSTDDYLSVGDARGVGVAAMYYSVDSATFSGVPSTYTAFSLTQEAAHTVRYYATDLVGNVEQVHVASVAVDGTPPQTRLLVQAPAVVLGSTAFVRGLGPLLFSATDYPSLAVGLAATYLSVDGGAPAPSSGTFALSEGFRTLGYASVDLLGNFESTHTARLKLDATPPGAVTTLLAVAIDTATVRLSWTAPGDDGAAGDILDAAVAVSFGTDPAAFSSQTATVILSSGALPAGTALALNESGLSQGTTYYAAVYTRDTAGNWSAASPAAAARTFTITTSNDGVASVDAPVPVAVTVVSTTSAAPAYTVAVASQGLTPSGTVFYELSSGLVFPATAPAIVSFTFDPTQVDPNSVTIYTFNASSMVWSSASIVNQTITMLPGGLDQITGDIFHTSLYAPMVRDTVPPVTSFSLAGSSAVLEGRLFASEASSGVFTAQDYAPRGGVASGLAQTTYALDGGTVAAYAASFPFPGGHHTVSFRSVDKAGNIETPKGAEVFVDTAAPVFSLSADQPTFPLTNGKVGFGVVTTTVTVTLAAADPLVAGAQAGLASFIWSLDGSSAAVSLAPGVASATASAFLGSGGHTFLLTASDRLGHLSQQSLFVAVGDTVPPVTGISFLGPQARLPDGSILVAAKTGLVLSATDYAQAGVPPAGVAGTFYRLTPTGQTPGSFSVYASSFVIAQPEGGRQVDFYSTDRAGNTETAKSTSVVLDSLPPALALSFPSPADVGLCRLVQGPLSVRGSVQDLHLSSWSLAANGVLVGSGAANAAGTLGLFNAAGLSGPIPLALSAQDLVFNASAASLQLQAGQPARDLALGGHGTFNKPRGVATAPNRVYVSDTNDDQVRVFDGAGNSLATFGGKGASVTFNKPAGLVVDPAGNILVADANGKRVVKLSAAGAQLAVFGQGTLQKPTAVALSGGNVVVADAQAGQLVVFAAGGALLSRVSLPPASASADDATEPRPMALAADFAGNVWVADQAGGRVLRYDPGFNLAQTVAGFQKPDGVAVSPSGACLAVADAGTARLTTFDAALAAQLAAFGVQGDINPNKGLPSDFDLNQPAQLAFAADGSLLVADRNNDLVQGFGLPGAPVVVAMGSSPGASGSSAKLSAVGGAVAALVVTQRVGAVEGGSVAHPDGTAVQIPPASLPQDQDVSVNPASTSGSDAAARQAAMAGASLASASSAHEFGPEGLQFAQPATITLPYDPSLVGAMNPSQLKVAYWNPTRGAWETLASNVDSAGHTVSAQVMHFSLYQVLAPAQAFTTMADPEATFSLRTIYVFPNPAVGGAKPTISVAVGVADRVKINIYDVAGRAVNSVTLDGAPKTVSDELGTHYAYEYTWDGHIPSGVYIYAVTAEKAGNAPIRRIGKFAVVR